MSLLSLPSESTSSKSRTPLFGSNRSTQMKKRRRQVPLCEQEPRAAEVIAGNPEAERAVGPVDVRVLAPAVLEQEAPGEQGVRPVHGLKPRGRPSALFTFFQL